MDDIKEKTNNYYQQQIRELSELLEIAEKLPDDPEAQIAAQHFRHLLNAHKSKSRNIDDE